MVQFRNGYVDEKTAYSAGQLRWVHDGSDWDVVAIRDAKAGPAPARPLNGSYT